MADEKNGGKKNNKTTDKSSDFDFLSGLSFMMWGILIFTSKQYSIALKRDDIINLAQTTSALAGIALAALAIIQKKEVFLKMLLALVTLIFVLATTTAWLTAIIVGGTASEVQNLHLKYSLCCGIIFIFYGGLRISASLPDVLNESLSIPVNTWGKWRKYSRGTAFILPIFLVDIWSNDAYSFGPTVALSIGGMIYLLAATGYLIFAILKEAPI